MLQNTLIFKKPASENCKAKDDSSSETETNCGQISRQERAKGAWGNIFCIKNSNKDACSHKCHELLPHLWTILRRLTKSWVRSGWKGEICELLSCRQAGKTREVQPGKNRPRRTRDSLWRNVGWTHRSKMQQQRPRWRPAEQRPGHTPEIILIWIHSLNGGKSLLINVVGGNDNEIFNQILTFLVNDILMLASLNLQIGLSTSPSSMDRVVFIISFTFVFLDSITKDSSSEFFWRKTETLHCEIRIPRSWKWLETFLLWNVLNLTFRVWLTWN